MILAARPASSSRDPGTRCSASSRPPRLRHPHRRRVDTLARPQRVVARACRRVLCCAAPLLPASCPASAPLAAARAAAARRRAGAAPLRPLAIARQPVAGARAGRRAAGPRAGAVRAARGVPGHAARPARGRVHGDAGGPDGDRDGHPGRAPRARAGRAWKALARALLDDPALRARTRLRIAPSALRGVSVVRWLGPGTRRAFTRRPRSTRCTRRSSSSRCRPSWPPRSAGCRGRRCARRPPPTTRRRR